MTTLLKRLTQEIANIKNTVHNMQQPSHPPSHTPYGGGRGGRGGGGGGRGGYGRGGGGGNGQPCDKSKYCHTHGATVHTSWWCKKPKDGHQYEATFQNKMGGSTKNCE